MRLLFITIFSFVVYININAQVLNSHDNDSTLDISLDKFSKLYYNQLLIPVKSERKAKFCELYDSSSPFLIYNNKLKKYSLWENNSKFIETNSSILLLNGVYELKDNDRVVYKIIFKNGVRLYFEEYNRKTYNIVVKIDYTKRYKNQINSFLIFYYTETGEISSKSYYGKKNNKWQLIPIINEN